MLDVKCETEECQANIDFRNKTSALKVNMAYILSLRTITLTFD